MHLSSFHLPVVLDQDTAAQQDAVIQIKHLGKRMQVCNLARGHSQAGQFLFPVSTCVALYIILCELIYVELYCIFSIPRSQEMSGM